LRHLEDVGVAGGDFIRRDAKGFALGDVVIVVFQAGGHYPDIVAFEDETFGEFFYERLGERAVEIEGDFETVVVVFVFKHRLFGFLPQVLLLFTARGAKVGAQGAQGGIALCGLCEEPLRSLRLD
jgi:hypothetical protein